MRTVRLLVLATVTAVLCNCGSASAPALAAITISNYQYSPSNLSVKPGTTITVVNGESVGHSLTSEAALNDYTAGGVNSIAFDTGVFTTGYRTFTIPTTAAAGTVIPYFCTSHLSMMGQGTITIVAP